MILVIHATPTNKSGVWESPNPKIPLSTLKLTTNRVPKPQMERAIRKRFCHKQLAAHGAERQEGLPMPAGELS